MSRTVHLQSLRRGPLRLLYRDGGMPERLLEAVEIARRAHPVPRTNNQPPAGEGAWWLHGGDRANVVGVRLSGHDDVCVKFFHDARLRVRVRNFLGFSKARKAFRLGLELERTGVVGPRVVALAEYRPFGPCLLMMELLPSAVALEEILLNRAGPAAGVWPSISDLARMIGRFTGRMHRAGVTHMDFSSRNILIAATAGGPAVYLVDFEDLRFGRADQERARFADLAALNHDIRKLVPVRERLRFLHDYASALGQSAPDQIRLMRKLFRREVDRKVLDSG